MAKPQWIQGKDLSSFKTRFKATYGDLVAVTFAFWLLGYNPRPQIRDKLQDAG